MNNYTLRQIREIEHNKKILPKANKIWGREGLAGRMRLERRANLIREIAKLQPSKRALEIGCGTGELTYYLGGCGAQIIATDIFPEFLELARKRVPFGNVQFQSAAGESLENFPSSYFDLVYGASILHHLDMEPAFDNIHRVLKSGGQLVFSEPNMLCLQIILQKNIPFIKKWLGDSPDETAFFRWQMQSFLKKKNFLNISVEPFDFLHPALPEFLAKISQKAGIFLEKVPLLREFAGSLLIVAKKQ